MLDVPRIAHEELGFQGLGLHTSHLAGWESAKLDRLRDEADKAACPCLVLSETAPIALGHADPPVRDQARDRADRILRVAHRLGCSSVAMTIEDPGAASLTESLSLTLKDLVAQAERLELNFLMAPGAGLTETPEQLTALIRRVGGFRIGSYPDFQTAQESGDLTAYLRALAPYASAISASVLEFDAKGAHQGFDLDACIAAIRAVGYDQILNIEYRGKNAPNEQLTFAKSAIESALQADEPGAATATKS